MDDGRICDATGQIRLIYRTPNWEEFVCLAVTEIRLFGGASIQINRRLRAMLENLIQTLPASRAELLRAELKLLHRSADRLFFEPEDRAMAEVSDSQGVGGKTAAAHHWIWTPTRARQHDHDWLINILVSDGTEY